MENRSFRKSLAVAVVALFLGVSVIPSVIGDNPSFENTIYVDDNVDWWPMFHHDAQNTGYSTSKGPNTSNICWTYSVDKRFYCESPVIYNGKVYVINNYNTLICLDLFSGEKIWESSNDMYSGVSPTIADNKLYAKTYRNEKSAFSCINAENGSFIWSNSDVGTGFIWLSSPTIYNNRVYVGVNNVYFGNKPDDCIFCLDAENGDEIWRYRFEGNIISTPALMDGKLYFGSDCEGIVYCLDVEDGDEIWQFDTTSIIASSPTAVDGKVFIASWSRLFCLDGDSGDEIWSFTSSTSLHNPPPIDDLYSTPAVVDGRVYMGSIAWGDNIWCLNATTGKTIWKFDGYGCVRSSPAVADGKIYFGAGDFEGMPCYMCCLDTNNGEMIWNDWGGASYYPSPAVAGGKVVSNSGYKVICYGESPNLEIGDIHTDSNSIIFTIRNNVSSCAARKVNCTVSISGGVLNKLNMSKTDFFDYVYPFEEIKLRYNNSITSDFFIFGVGLFELIITLESENAESVSKEAKGFIFGPFIFM